MRGFLQIALFVIGVSSAFGAAPSPENGFYALEVRHLYDSRFDAASVPRLTYWFQEVDPSVGDGNYGVVPEASNEFGAFIRTRVVGHAEERVSPLRRFESRMEWRVRGRAALRGVAELVSGSGGETILRLFSVKKARPLVDYALVPLGAHQRDAASALRLDPYRFSRSIYLAHRGAARIPLLNLHGVFPGNTIESMEHALWNGFPGFEIDIQMTKDRVLVVSHDDKLGVSTDCVGKISERNFSELGGCRVAYTGVVPDVKAFHNRALIFGKIPALRTVLDRYLADPRLERIVLDVKPGEVEAQVAAFSALMREYPYEALRKVIFLMRSPELIHRLQSVEGFDSPLYAWEGSTGWEILQRAATLGDPYAVVLADHPQLKDDRFGLSLSLGLGLGMAGIDGTPKEGGLTAILQIVKSLPKAIGRLFTHGFGEGSVDIDAMSWSKRNKRALLDVVAASKRRAAPIVGWTVNTRPKIEWLRRNSPDVDFILSDLPFRRLAEIQLRELASAL